MPTGYSISQIRLHWLVAGLVLVQFLNEDAIGAAWRAVRRGAAESPGGPLVLAHIWGGVAILVFVLWRIGLRLTRGAPPLPPEEPRMLRLVAAVTHGTLYLLLLLVPATGLAAWFGGIVKAGGVHELLQSVLMYVIFLHIAGALFQQALLKTDVLGRMLHAER